MAAKTASRNGDAASMASRHEPVDFAREYVNRLDEMANDPSKDIRGMPPNMGQYALPHVQTFQGMFGTYTRAYLQSDEAAKDSTANARAMRNDCGIMECVEHRQLAVAMLDWQLVPEDEKSPQQAKLVEELTKIIRRIPQFVDYLFCCQHAIWYGRYGIQHRFGWENVGGQMRVMPKRRRANPGWLPINGDKLVFRYDDEWDDSMPDQVGILVGARFQSGRSKVNNRWDVEPTGRGLAYFLEDWESETVLVHKHIIEDGPWEFGIDAGVVHGVGIRSRIYWDWFQKQEMLAFLMSYLERSAGGIEIWSYPAGDTNALTQAKAAAKERLADGRNIVFFPKPMGDQYGLYDVQVIEPGMAGIETLHSLLSDYFGHRIKRYVLGQVLTSEAEATGLGSGVSDLHLNTFLQIVKYDATKLEETITDQLVRVLKNWNFPEARDVHVRFQFNTESSDVEARLGAIHQAWEMGAGIAEREVLDLVGARQPEKTDRVLLNPATQQQPQQPGMGGDQFGNDGIDGAIDGQPQSHESREDVADRLFGEIQNEMSAELGHGGNESAGDVDRGQFGADDSPEKFRRDVIGKLWRDRYASNRQGTLFNSHRQGNLFAESDHPRDDSGKFTSGGGGDGKKTEKKANETETPPEREPEESIGDGPILDFSPSDVDYDRAYNAHRGMSHVPEKRAKQRQQEYADHMQSVVDQFEPNAKTPAQRAALESALARYKEGYLKRFNAMLDADSRTMSPMITGPAKFPVRSNQKKMDTAHKRLKELLEYESKGQKAIARELNDSMTPEQQSDEAFENISGNIDREINTIKSIDSGVGQFRGFTRSAFTNSIAGKIERMAYNGEHETVARALEYLSEHNNDSSKPLFTSRHKVWKMADVAKASAEKKRESESKPDSTSMTFKGASVSRSTADDRVRIEFDDKPSAELRKTLKSSGWRWSPRNTAWQRKNTDNAISSAKMILTEAFGEPEKYRKMSEQRDRYARWIELERYAGQKSLFNEDDHPRDADGKFGSGGSKSKKKKKQPDSDVGTGKQQALFNTGGKKELKGQGLMFGDDMAVGGKNANRLKQGSTLQLPEKKTEETPRSEPKNGGKQYNTSATDKQMEFISDLTSRIMDRNFLDASTTALAGILPASEGTKAEQQAEVASHRKLLVNEIENVDWVDRSKGVASQVIDHLKRGNLPGAVAVSRISGMHDGVMNQMQAIRSARKIERDIKFAPAIDKYQREQQRDRYERWITLNAQGDAGDRKGGTPVQIDDKGRITKGPKSLVKKTLKSLTTPKKSGKQRTAINEAAKSAGVKSSEFREIAESILGHHKEQHGERESAKRRLRDMTGLSERDIAKVENAGFDFSSKSEKFRERFPSIAPLLAKFDQVARDWTDEHPHISQGGDDPAREAWDMLREGKTPAPEIDSPEVISETTHAIESGGNESDVDDTSFDFGQGDEPFSRRGERQRYRGPAN